MRDPTPIPIGSRLVRRRAGSAFTILEVLIAVGAIALIALAVSQVFSATGKAVRGGRRVSNITSFAAQIESRMREDFRAMTRDGFLLIQNEATNAFLTEQQEASAGGASKPERRIDELMFFVNGSFSTKRTPIHPDRVAKAAAARVYYGHGLNQRDTADSHYRPRVTDLNLTNEAPRFGSDGPNEYASGWTLVRHETLLIPPATAQPDPLLPDAAPPELAPANRQRDSDVQVDLQPAASSLFRALALVEPCGAGLAPRIRAEEGAPQFSSGLVDIATTDLSEIQAYVNTGATSQESRINDAGTPGDPNDDFAEVRLITPRMITDCDQRPLLNVALAPLPDFMHAWMLEALPTPSASVELVSDWGPPPGRVFYRPVRPANRVRLRVESEPPDFLGSLSGPAFTKPWERPDQVMLTSSVFVPRCTGFIVEWSFGESVNGQVVWYGLERRVDLDNDGDDDDDPAMADRYFGSYRVPVRDIYGRTEDADGTPYRHTVTEGLIHGPRFGLGSQREPVRSFFGYLDPTYGQTAGDPTQLPDIRDVDGDGVFEPQDGDISSLPDQIPWAWPKLVRVTLSLADPVDPSYEETFQFVFEVPPEQRR